MSYFAKFVGGPMDGQEKWMDAIDPPLRLEIPGFIAGKRWEDDGEHVVSTYLRVGIFTFMHEKTEPVA